MSRTSSARCPGYTVVGLHSVFEVTHSFSLFATVSNLFDAKYSNFGILSDPTGVGTPGVPADGVTNGPGVDNRFQSPSNPLAAWAGFRLTF